jgi:hypothetical protein
MDKPVKDLNNAAVLSPAPASTTVTIAALAN